MTKIEKIDLLEKFITANNLSFVEGVRNTDSVIISGYAQFIEVESNTDIELAIDNAAPEAKGYQSELERIFKFAKINSYKEYWRTDEAKKKYIF